MEKTRVLIIEGNAVVRYLCTAVIREIGLELIGAPDSVGAVGELLGSRPDIVLLNVEGEIGTEVTALGKEFLPFVSEEVTVIDTSGLRGRDILGSKGIQRDFELLRADLQRALGQEPTPL